MAPRAYDTASKWFAFPNLVFGSYRSTDNRSRRNLFRVRITVHDGKNGAVLRVHRVVRHAPQISAQEVILFKRADEALK